MQYNRIQGNKQGYSIYVANLQQYEAADLNQQLN